MIRILNAEAGRYCDHASTILRQIGQVDAYTDLTRKQLLTIVPRYDVLITRLAFQIDQAIMDRGTNLQVIVTATTGLDHIDLEYAEQRGIKVLSLHGESEFLRHIASTAEHTWALLLALMRRLPWAYQSVLALNWERDQFIGNELASKRLGIVGLGRIGEKIARYGVAFGMRVHAYDPSPLSKPESVIFEPSLTALLETSDILTLHVPLNKHTQCLIGIDEIRRLPRGALIVNTARGRLIDEAELVEALREGHVGGVAVDVLQDEHLDVKKSPLMEIASEYTNVLVTPHIGGATVEAMQATEIYMAKRLLAYIESGVEKS